jgi:hypothetical protein
LATQRLIALPDLGDSFQAETSSLLEAMPVWLKRFSGDTNVEKARAEFERAATIGRPNVTPA